MDSFSIPGLNKESAVFRRLSQSRAQLENAAVLDDHQALAVWNNHDDRMSYCRPGHHTLSCYLSGGYGIRRLKADRVTTGGAPDRFCLMPGGHRSDWLVDGPLRFVHLYFSESRLQQQAEQTLDRDGRLLQLQDHTFVDDPWIAGICRNLILPLDWHDAVDRTALSHASQLLQLHLLKNYSNWLPQLPRIRGGLAPAIQRRICDYIEHHLDHPLTLSELAAVADLSEYHFARMFRQSMKEPPHQFVTRRRLARARQLLQDTDTPLVQIAQHCGFSGQSHFSRLFRSTFGLPPGRFRRNNRRL